jgi:hypothetical protein
MVLAAAAVPHGLIYRAPDVLEDPQYRALVDGGVVPPDT